MKKLALITAAILFTGCSALQKQQVTTNAAGVSTTNQVFDVNAVLPEIRLAAEEGTRLPLQIHPEWRNEYQKAVDDLKDLEALPSINFSLITAIVNRIPAKELKSSNAQIAIQGGQVLLSLADTYLASHGKTVPLETVADIHLIVTALREGVEAGLR